MKSNECINCGNISNDKYCGSCGQKIDVKRLRWSVLFSELNQRVLGFDNKFAKTVKDLTVRPGAVVQEYIEGNRIRYVNPVGYFFILITVFVILIGLFDVDMMKFSFGDMPTGPDGNQKRVLEMQQTLMGNMKILSFLLVPFFALSNYWFFRKKGYNLLENAVLVFYTQAHPILFSIIMLFTYVATGETFTMIGLMFSVLYFAYTCASFYEGNKVWYFIKGILSYALGMILFTAVTMALGVAYVALTR